MILEMYVDGTQVWLYSNFKYEVYFMTSISLSDSHYIEKNSFTYNAFMA